MSTDNKETKKKSGLFSKLKSLAFEDTDAGEEQSQPIQKTDVKAASNFVYSTTQPTALPAGMPNMGGQFDEKFYNSFLEVLEKNNIDGVDYLEFSKSKKNMDGIQGMAEPLKYQSAFASLKANSNLTKDYLLQSADIYLTKLDEEEKEFNSEMQNEINIQINSRAEQVNFKSEEIKKKQELINALQSDISILNTEIGTLNVEAQTIKSNIESTAKNFKVTLDAFKSQIVADKTNIQNFLS